MSRRISDDLLRGSYDLHIHASPDITPRKLNVIELVKEESKYKVAGIAVKSHHVPTYAHAEIANSLGLETTVYGGIALNHPVCGNLDERIVETALNMGARFVHMPTISAAHHLEIHGEDPSEGIRVTNEKGRIIPEIVKIIQLATDYDTILATGHISPGETKILAMEAASLGLRKIVVTHPESHIINMSLEDQMELTEEYGLYMEYCALSIYQNGRRGIDEIAEQIKALHPENVIISTDLGQPESPSPIEGLTVFIKELYERGLSEDDILKMINGNPSRLIGR